MNNIFEAQMFDTILLDFKGGGGASFTQILKTVLKFVRKNSTDYAPVEAYQTLKNN